MTCLTLRQLWWVLVLALLLQINVVLAWKLCNDVDFDVFNQSIAILFACYFLIPSSLAIRASGNTCTRLDWAVQSVVALTAILAVNAIVFGWFERKILID